MNIIPNNNYSFSDQVTESMVITNAEILANMSPTRSKKVNKRLKFTRNEVGHSSPRKLSNISNHMHNKPSYDGVPLKRQEPKTIKYRGLQSREAEESEKMEHGNKNGFMDFSKLRPLGKNRKPARRKPAARNRTPNLSSVYSRDVPGGEREPRKMAQKQLRSTPKRSNTTQRALSQIQFDIENRLPASPLKPKTSKKSRNCKSPIRRSRTYLQKKQHKSNNKMSSPKQLDKSSAKKKIQRSLTTEEKATYGNRGIKGYKKISLLGKGGQAIVWLMEQQTTGKKFAVKQISLSGFVTDSTLKKEIDIDSILFKPQLEKENSISGDMGYPTESERFNYEDDDYIIQQRAERNLIRIVDTHKTSKDVFLVLEVGGNCLSSELFSFKGEFHKGERIYQITNYSFYNDIKSNTSLLGEFVRRMLEGLSVFHERGVIHCDLKSENVLIRYNKKSKKLEDLKIIDFGAAIDLTNPGYVSITTPEYLPPEYLRLFDSKSPSSNSKRVEWLTERMHPWSMDVWSLGIIILEILVGVPIWLGFKCRTKVDGKVSLTNGLLSSSGRSNEKIASKAIKLVKNLSKLFKEQIGSVDNELVIISFLQRCLVLNPKMRPSPEELLQHPLVQGGYQSG